MAEKPRKLLPSKGGVLQNFTDHIRLILRLMGDQRVNALLKLLPFGAMIYLLIPDLAPGPLDDALILWLGSTLFVELCPVDVVQEHEERLQKELAGEWKDPDPDDVIDADSRDIDP